MLKFLSVFTRYLFPNFHSQTSRLKSQPEYFAKRLFFVNCNNQEKVNYYCYEETHCHQARQIKLGLRA